MQSPITQIKLAERQLQCVNSIKRTVNVTLRETLVMNTG